ncbi:unnamed protein product [Bursaphelenchus okinawaensis]|uniref:NTR domain-containing protein n=1 Tax=Bursaphelenchus okinawaensis TaxID=465554 RepID=A0A811L8G6_9BILA|nr:unnamed protein product [Bursaphelenchus okinawaensis]CAG9119857.1 unnamed protein product [Bursaphelenchus okinawaensis]
MTSESIFKVVVLLVFVSYPIYCCTCAFGKVKQKYCDAEWVSHAKIIDFEIVNGSDYYDSFPEVKDVKYKVEFKKIFKLSQDLKDLNVTELPTEVFTPADDSLCGIFLEKGQEYLLSGIYFNGTMSTNLCMQILFDDRQKSMENNILLWSEVPKNTSTGLQAKEYEPCPKHVI